MSTAPELDPLFLKAMALLSSKHPDSGRLLKELVSDYREKHYGGLKKVGSTHFWVIPKIQWVDILVF